MRPAASCGPSGSGCCRLPLNCNKRVGGVEKGVAGMETAWRTDKGKVRPHNEDAVELFRTDFGSLVAVVADGMGGHRSGEVASRQAVQVIRRELRSLSPDASTEEQKKRLFGRGGEGQRGSAPVGLRKRRVPRDGDDGDRRGGERVRSGSRPYRRQPGIHPSRRGTCTS